MTVKSVLMIWKNCRTYKASVDSGFLSHCYSHWNLLSAAYKCTCPTHPNKECKSCHLALNGTMVNKNRHLSVIGIQLSKYGNLVSVPNSKTKGSSSAATTAHLPIWWEMQNSFCVTQLSNIHKSDVTKWRQQQVNYLLEKLQMHIWINSSSVYAN